LKKEDNQPIMQCESCKTKEISKEQDTILEEMKSELEEVKLEKSNL
jgi:hypothetical protein